MLARAERAELVKRLINKTVSNQGVNELRLHCDGEPR
jgi:hypothetical protein